MPTVSPLRTSKLTSLTALTCFALPNRPELMVYRLTMFSTFRIGSPAAVPERRCDPSASSAVDVARSGGDVVRQPSSHHGSRPGGSATSVRSPTRGTTTGMPAEAAATSSLSTGSAHG